MPRESTPIWFCISVDTECDKGPAWRTQQPLQFRSVREGIPQTLMPLCREWGVRPTLLLSPEVIDDEASAATLAAIPDCELGTHLHGEYVEPQADYRADCTNMPQLAYPPAVEEAKLARLTETFVDRFGFAPRSFRAGRFGIGPSSLGFLDRLGYRVDSSVTPFRRHDFGALGRNDHWDAPLHPYHPAPGHPTRPGNLRLWELPVSTAIAGMLTWPRLLRQSVGRWLHPRKRLCRVLGVSRQAIWLRPSKGEIDEQRQWVDALVEHRSRQHPLVLNVMFHSNELTPAASPYAQTAAEVDRIVASLREVARHAISVHGARPATFAEIAENLG